MRGSVMHWTGSVQWTWIKTAEEHYDAIVMNEYRMIRAHSAHLDLPKPKKSHANVKNEHGNSWPFSALGPLHWRIVQTRILSCKRWLPNVHSHLLHKNCPLRIAIMKKEPGDEDESEEEIMHTWCTHHLPPIKHPRKSKNRRKMETESQLVIKCPPAKLGAHCQHSDLANSSPGSKQSGTSITPSWSPHSWLEASIVPTQIDPFPMEIFTSQSTCSYYCPPWSPHPQLIVFQLLPCSTIMSSLWDSLSQISHMLPGLSHCIPFHPSLSFLVSKICLPV